MRFSLLRSSLSPSSLSILPLTPSRVRGEQEGGEGSGRGEGEVWEERCEGGGMGKGGRRGEGEVLGDGEVSGVVED